MIDKSYTEIHLKQFYISFNNITLFNMTFNIYIRLLFIYNILQLKKGRDMQQVTSDNL